MFLERSIFARMKNKYVTKCLCVTLAAAMVMSCAGSVQAAETGNPVTDFGDGGFTDEPSETPESTPEPTTEPQPTAAPEPTAVPEEPSATPEPTAAPEEPSATPEPTLTPDPTTVPEEPSATPEPSETPTATPEITATPEPSVTPAEDQVKTLVEKIESLARENLTLNHEAKVKELRKLYDALTDQQKKQVTNYKLLVSMEDKISNLKKQNSGQKEGTDSLSDGTGAAKTGTPVYYSGMVSNLHAGKEFYLDSLKDNYHLTFSDDFVDVMNQIEKEYKEKNKLTDASDSRENGQTSSGDSLLVRNWQDILAVYVYQKSAQREKEFTLDSSAKKELAEIFAQMNPLIRDENNPSHVSYGNYHINTYIKENNIPQEERAVLKKYVETDCKLLCAIVTDAKGFIRQSVGDDVSEERVNVIAAAYSLVGEVGYFWGGKSTVIGEDPSWGNAEKVSAEGSPSTGTVRAYGLDCSGFVTWSVINGYLDQSMQQAVGDGTSEQWLNANVVSEQDAQPGDLVFQRGPEAGSDNHVGIICGKTDAGDWIAVHCSSGKNGVTVGEAYGASFRYIRQPSFYPTKEEQAEMISAGQSASNASPETVSDLTSDETVPSETVSGGETVQENTSENTDDIIVSIDDAQAAEPETTEQTGGEIEVTFEDAGSADGEAVSDGGGESKSAETTETLQGILDQNASVSRGAAAVFPEQTDFGEIEVTFQN